MDSGFVLFVVTLLLGWVFGFVTGVGVGRVRRR